MTDSYSRITDVIFRQIEARCVAACRDFILQRVREERRRFLPRGGMDYSAT